MEVEQDGKTVATIKKALVSPLRDRYSIEVEDEEDLEAKGNIVDHEFKIERDGDQVAEVSKRWFRSATRMGSRSPKGRTTPCSSPSRSVSTRWAAAEGGEDGLPGATTLSRARSLTSLGGRR